MAYIGQKGGTVSTLTSKTLDTMTGDGSDATLTLSQTPASVNDVAVYLDGVFQRPTNEYTLSGNVITFTTAPANGVSVCAVAGGGEHIGSPMAGSVTTDKLIDGTITSAMVATMSSSKLTGALGALDGSALTGIPSSIMKNASDPAIDTNPSGGLGTVWANTTSGEMFVLTDATTDANVWYNVGGGDGDVQPWEYGGTTYGYSSGGFLDGGPYNNMIERFSFTSDGNSVDTGQNLVRGIYYGSSTGASSATHGYTTGGYVSTVRYNEISKFQFNSSSNATDVGDMTTTRQSPTQTNSETHGYSAGGATGLPTGASIDKFTFASDANGTDVGDLNINLSTGAGSASTTHGYVAGKDVGASAPNHKIEKFTFASDGNAISVGNLTASTYISYCGGSSSSTHGYRHGGGEGPANTRDNVIDRFAFASDADATDVGNLTQGRGNCGGSSSTTHGYCIGEAPANIEKYSYASSGNATNIGNLVANQTRMAWTTGNQV